MTSKTVRGPAEWRSQDRIDARPHLRRRCGPHRAELLAMSIGYVVESRGSRGAVVRGWYPGSMARASTMH